MKNLFSANIRKKEEPGDRGQSGCNWESSGTGPGCVSCQTKCMGKCQGIIDNWLEK